MMTKPDRPGPGDRYHLIGVAGVGMSALAQALADCGAGVSGSDRFLDHGEALEIFSRLRRAGVDLHAQDGSGLSGRVSAVVCSTAIEEDNPDLLAATAQGVPVVHRAEMLARLCRGRQCIAVSGTAGKTTVTGMVGWTLEQMGLDPNVVNGGSLVDWRRDDRVGSTRGGSSDLWVVEADESDRSLLRFEPTWSAVTNISRDHFDLEELERLFTGFAERTSESLVYGGAAASLFDGFQGKAAGGPRVRRVPGRAERGDAGWSFTYEGRSYPSPLPGRHNAENALVALTLCEEAGCAVDEAAEALASFRGIERRLECVGHGGGIRVLDEYAHNPAKIAAAWSVAREDADRIVAVWRPHGFAPLRLMWDDLVDTFSKLCSGGDRLYLLPVYYAGGTAEADVSADQLASLLHAGGAAAMAVSDYAQLEREIADTVTEGDTVMVMGARDPHLPELARNLAARLCGTMPG